MKYLIVRPVAGLSGAIELTENRYKSIIRARSNLLIFLTIEEKMTILLDNMSDYEKSTLGLVVDKLLHYDDTWISKRTDFMLVNRMLANVLFSARLYTDQVKHDISKVYGPHTKRYENIEALFRQAYDSSIEYRTMEALRNYVQHCTLPVHGISYPSESYFSDTDTADDYDELGNAIEIESDVSVHIHPLILISKLENRGKFKSSVRNELVKIGDTIPITLYLREYIRNICTIHSQIRNCCRSDVLQWEAVFSKVKQEAQEFFSSDPIPALAAVIQEGDREGLWKEIVPITSEIYEIRQVLEKRNSVCRSISQMHATGKCYKGLI